MAGQDDTPVDLEAALDRLYGGDPAAFVGGRNELVKALRRSGDRDAADRIGRLARPSPVAFAVNRLYFEAPELLDALRETGGALRAAQESAADADAFNDRKRAHERSLRAAVERALRLAESAGAGSGASFRRRLEMTLNLLGTAPAEGEDASARPGRMSVELSPAGFDAFGGVEIPARPPPQRASKTARAPADAARLEQVASLKAALDAADKELRRLEREAELADETERRAARDAEEAAQRAEAARERHAETAARARTARSSADEARRQVDEARRTLAELEE